MEKRLNEGAKTFSEIQSTQKEIAEQIQAKPVPLYKTIGLAITMVVIVSAWVWQAARYPDRSEYNQRAKNVDKSLSDLKYKQIQINADVQAIKNSQQRTEKAVGEIGKSIQNMAKRRP